ncbi:hypothetical protein DITRI_Ditri20bG0034800 [Diplodiscus trichospermus]
MASGNDEYFRSKGPSHLRSVDWNNAYHRRSVAASLVEGVYELDRHRQAGRQGSQSSAPPWWEFFHFELIYQLVDDDDGSIFGAIFRYNPPAYSYHRTIDRSPPYVIAFRGTSRPESGSFERDLELDIKIIKNGLHQTSRFATAMKAVQAVVTAVGPSNLWLTGHSLGAAMAMLTGKTMAKAGKFLEAFLFNPPHVSPPVNHVIKDKKVRHGLRFAGTIIKAGLAFAAAGDDQRKGIEYKDSLAAISGWIPRLFVNQEDPICSEYIYYFEHRKKLQDLGAGSVARLTSKFSLGNLFMSAAGVKGVENSEPLHLLPSANLTVNLSPSQDFSQAHELRQWWRQDLNLKCSVYEYK